MLFLLAKRKSKSHPAPSTLDLKSVVLMTSELGWWAQSQLLLELEALMADRIWIFSNVFSFAD